MAEKSGRWAKSRGIGLACSLLAMILGGLVSVSSALATSCIPVQSTLQEDYELADAIILAQVSSCAHGDPIMDWNCEDRLFNLDVIEILKDSVPSRDYGGAYPGADAAWGCGLSYKLGETYLVFLNGKGG